MCLNVTFVSCLKLTGRVRNAAPSHPPLKHLHRREQMSRWCNSAAPTDASGAPTRLAGGGVLIIRLEA